MVYFYVVYIVLCTEILVLGTEVLSLFGFYRDILISLAKSETRPKSVVLAGKKSRRAE